MIGLTLIILGMLLSIINKSYLWLALIGLALTIIYGLYKLLKYNETLLEERIQHGYDTLLNKLGIKQVGNSFTINDIDKLIETLATL